MIPGIDGVRAIIPVDNTAIGDTITARYDNRATLRHRGMCAAFSFADVLSNHFLDGESCSSIAETRKGMATIANRRVPNALVMAIRPETGSAESRIKPRTHVCLRYSSMVRRASQTAIVTDDSAAKTIPVTPIRNMAVVTVNGLDSERFSLSFEGRFLFALGIIRSIIA